MITTNQQRTDEYLKTFNREKVVKSLIKKDNPIILGVGTNVGKTLDEFKGWWPNSQVHCFEFQEECWKDLEDKVLSNNYKDVTINKYAVGDEEKDADFFLHDITSGQSGLHKINYKSSDSINLNNLINGNSLEAYKKSLNHKRIVKVKTLKDYIATKNIEHVDLIKIDTQGYEPEVLSGLKENLSNVDVVITELMFYDFYERSLSFSDIENFLIPSGFSLFDISHISKNPMNGRTDWADVIYTHERIKSKF